MNPCHEQKEFLKKFHLGNSYLKKKFSLALYLKEVKQNKTIWKISQKINNEKIAF